MGTKIQYRTQVFYVKLAGYNDICIYRVLTNRSWNFRNLQQQNRNEEYSKMSK